jgi:hypothetical protein
MNGLEIYDAARPLIGNGDIVNWRMKSLLARIILKFTADSHTSLVTRLDYQGMADRIFIVESRAKTELNLLSKRLAGAHGSASLLRLKDYWAPARPYIAGWVCEQAGNPYDVKGLLGNLFGRVSMDARNFFCSELAWFATREGARRGIACNAGDPDERWRLIEMDIEETEKLLKDRAPRPGDFRRLPMYLEPVQIL